MSFFSYTGNTSTDDACAICLGPEEFPLMPMVHPWSCHHKFHALCIDGRNLRICPMCRNTGRPSSDIRNIRTLFKKICSKLSPDTFSQKLVSTTCLQTPAFKKKHVSQHCFFRKSRNTRFEKIVLMKRYFWKRWFENKFLKIYI